MEDLAYRLTLADVSNRDPAYLETIFSLANGHFGMRAGDILKLSNTAGTMVNGFYESSPIQYGEVAFGYAKENQTAVMLPDLRVLTLKDGKNQLFTTTRLLGKTLNLATGTLTEQWEASDPWGKRLQVALTTILEQPFGTHASLDYQITSLDYTGPVYLSKSLQLATESEISQDPRKARLVNSLNEHSLMATDETMAYKIETQASRQSIILRLDAGQKLTNKAELKPNQSVSYQVCACVSAINAAEIPAPMAEADIARKASAFWTDFWQRSATKIEGDPDLDRAIHYNLFQLVSSAGQDGKTNISAKGLSGSGYEGHYFWDTEMYLLPFLTYTNPAIAKQLLLYRAHVLPQAEARARVLGVSSGALFAWRTINGEEASAYFPASTAQYHIDGDVAFAVNRYYAITQDRDFMQEAGLKLLVETARFWANFGSWVTRGDQARFEFHTVTGPDEYSALVNNNYYTNHMAQFNLQKAAEFARALPESAAELQVSQDEIKDWTKKAAAVYLPYSQDKQINEQDDDAFQKPVWPFATTPKSHYPLLLHYHPLDLYRHQVNKQADTLLADYLFDDISPEQLQREYRYYESITTHDSSLSRSIFSALAARMGDVQAAYRYFMDTAEMDLIDLQGNAADGLHIANLGGSWLSLATGFGGVQMKAGRLYLTNHLPKKWQGLTLRLQVQGRLLEVHYQKQATKVKLLAGKPLTVVVDHKEQTVSKADDRQKVLS